MHNTASFRRAAFYSQLKSKVGNVLAKAIDLRTMATLTSMVIYSFAHTYPSHSQTSRLLFTSLSSSCTPFPRFTSHFLVTPFHVLVQPDYVVTLDPDVNWCGEEKP
jgi:hypothetical protein